VHQAVGLSPATLAAARRAGALRHTRRGHRILYKGSWILAWLESEAVGPDAGKGVARAD
jgi:hypothetical protein